MNHLRVIEDSRAAGFVQSGRRLLEDRLRQLPPRLPGQVCIAELQRPGCQAVAPSFSGDVAELVQRMQQPAHRRRVQSRPLSQFAHRELAPVRSERFDQGEPTGQRSDEFGFGEPASRPVLVFVRRQTSRPPRFCFGQNRPGIPVRAYVTECGGQHLPVSEFPPNRDASPEAARRCQSGQIDKPTGDPL